MTTAYEVTWANVYEADSPLDALRQAIADIDTVLRYPDEGPNLFLIRDWESVKNGLPATPVIMPSTAIDEEEEVEL